MALPPDEPQRFVSFETPREKGAPLQREAKTFPTEEQAKAYAKEMVLADRKNVMAGTFLGAPDRRI